MTALVDWLTSQLQTNPAAVAAIVMLLAMAEALIVVGTFVPGVTIILAISAVAGASGEGLMPVFLATAAGTIAGDFLSYAAGRRYGHRVAAWGPLRSRPHVFAAAERQFARRGAMSVAIARFIPAIRTLVPTFAGIAKMPALTFVAANGIAGIVWAALHVFAAGFVGNVFAAIGGRLAALLAGALILLCLIIWIARIAAAITFSYVGRLRRRTHRWVMTREGRTARFLAWTLDPDDLTGLLFVLWSGILFVALLSFAELTGEVWDADDIVTTDLALNRLVQSIRTPALDQVMVAVTMLGDALVLAVVALASIAWLCFRRRLWTAAAFTAGMLLPLAFVPLVKGLLARPRPLAELYSGVDNFSFPSGHTTHSMVLFGLLAALVSGSFRSGWRWRWVLALAVAMIPLAIAASRIYLQAHWASDVVAGFAFAVAVTAAFVLAISWLPTAAVGWRGLAISAATALVLAGAVNLYFNYDKARVAYAPRNFSIPLTQSQWQTDGWRFIGSGRVSFDGDVESPFFLQWVGDTALLNETLAMEGWSVAPRMSLAGLASLLSSDASIETAPTLPQLHLGLPAETVWIKPLNSRERLVFRLWRSRYSVEGEPIFVGALGAEAFDRLGFLMVVEECTADDQDRAALRQAIAGRVEEGAASYRFRRHDPREFDHEGC